MDSHSVAACVAVVLVTIGALWAKDIPPTDPFWWAAMALGPGTVCYAIHRASKK